MRSQLSTPYIPVGISGCLLGQQVRYNGGHSKSSVCQNFLGEFFRYQPFCPEVSAGFGIPRPTMRLIGDPDAPTLTYTKNSEADLTEQLTASFGPLLEHCSSLDGYILKKDSPSCGMERVKVYQQNGHPHTTRGSGLFATALMQAYPTLPVEEDGRLNDAALRENFVMRVFAHHHFRKEVLEQPSYHRLLQFHSSYKYLLMAHSQTSYRALGKLLANSSQRPLEQLLQAYFSDFMAAIKQPAKRGSHCNVMQHILGYLKHRVASEARRDILEVFEKYRLGEVNLATPMTLLRHYIQQQGSDYIRAQRYLEPYPAKLGLRNQL